MAKTLGMTLHLPTVLYCQTEHWSKHIKIKVRQLTQQYLEIVILFNIHGYMFRLIFKPSSGQ